MRYAAAEKALRSLKRKAPTRLVVVALASKQLVRCA